jgi:hypothetical protein
MPLVVRTFFLRGGWGGACHLNILQEVASLQLFKKSCSELDSSCNCTVFKQNVGLVM